MKANLESGLSNEVASSRLIQQELAVSKVANMVKRLMKEKGTTNADLARVLAKDPGYVSRVLAGKMNLTLSTIADILWALGSSIEVASKPIDPRKSRPISFFDPSGRKDGISLKILHSGRREGRTRKR